MPDSTVDTKKFKKYLHAVFKTLISKIEEQDIEMHKAQQRRNEIRRNVKQHIMDDLGLDSIELLSYGKETEIRGTWRIKK